MDQPFFGKPLLLAIKFDENRFGSFVYKFRCHCNRFITTCKKACNFFKNHIFTVIIWEVEVNLKDIQDYLNRGISSSIGKAKSALQKTEEVTQIAQLKLEEHSLKKEIDKNYHQIGKIVYSKFMSHESVENDSDIKRLVFEINTYKDHIKENMEKMKNISRKEIQAP